MQITTDIENAVEDAYRKAEAYLNRTFCRPKIDYNLWGGRAGVAYPYRNHIKFNLDIARKNAEAFIRRTTYHEVAHIIAVEHYRERVGHGRCWKFVMKNIFGLKPERCHSYNMEGVKRRRTQKFAYCCAHCKQLITVGPAIHRKISLHGRSYISRCHRAALIPVQNDLTKV